MQQHVKIVAILSIVLGIAGAGLGILLFAILMGAGAISGDETAMLATGMIGIILGGVLVFLSLPAIIGGFGLLKFRNWARVIILIVGFLSLPGFPVGTAYGVYAIWALLNAQSQPLFAEQQPVTA